MIRRPPSPTRTAPLFPYPTLLRSARHRHRDDRRRARSHARAAAQLENPPHLVTLPYMRRIMRLHKARMQGRRDSDACTGKNYAPVATRSMRSEEHTSELKSLMRISYAVFCLKNKQK